MPLLLLYRAPSFGCSSFFVHRGLCKNRSIDVRGRTQCYRWTAATLFCVQIRTGFYDLYRTYVYMYVCMHTHSPTVVGGGDPSDWYRGTVDQEDECWHHGQEGNDPVDKCTLPALGLCEEDDQSSCHHSRTATGNGYSSSQ